MQPTTTNLGLANIEEQGALLKELRRAVLGLLMAISHFYSMGDRANDETIEQLGLPALLFRENAQENFQAAGWNVQAHNPCQGRALPGPKSAILEGAGLDTLPVAETVLEWCTLVAK